MATQPAKTVDELVARNFAADVNGEHTPVPKNVEKVKRPLPPVGHFGYTEEDAEKVKKENRREGATLDTSETKWDVGEDATPLEPAAFNTENAERSAAESARSDERLAERQLGDSRQTEARRSSQAEADDGRDSASYDAGGPSRASDTTGAGESRKTASRAATNKNKQQAPAAQNRAGAESKGDDGDNANNPGDASDKK